jgi:hypothetical protein
MTALTKRQLAHDILAGVIASTISIGLFNMGGCKPVSGTVPSNATAPTFYAQSAKVMADYSSILLSAQNLFVSAHAEGLVPDPTYKSGQQVFLTAAQDGQAIDSLIQSGASAKTIIGQVDALSATIASMPTVFHIENPQSQAEFQALTTTLTTLLNTVDTLVATSSGTQPAATGGAK